MAYNHGREERKWRIWKENEEKILRDCSVEESVIEEIRTYDRADYVFRSCVFQVYDCNFTHGILDCEKKEVKDIPLSGGEPFRKRSQFRYLVVRRNFHHIQKLYVS